MKEEESSPSFAMLRHKRNFQLWLNEILQLTLIKLMAKQPIDSSLQDEIIKSYAVIS